MNICGIIAEYDPLHSGHAWQLGEAARLSGADKVVCVLSGCFTQRGMPALLRARDRAEMALRAGADLVLQMPYSYSVAHAERFALGGVRILRQAGVNALSFGVEPEGLPWFEAAANLLEQPTDAFQARLRALLAQGLPFPQAQGTALAEALSCPPEALSLPNTVLAICYARMNRRLKAGMRLFPVPRSGSYHDAALPEGHTLPSASAVRAAILAGAWDRVEESMPPAAYAVLKKVMTENRWHAPEALTPLLRWTLRQEKDFSRLPDVSEGLENRLAAARNESTREAMIQAVKTRRYPYARISRLLTHALTGTDAARLSKQPEYAYVLGFRGDASRLLNSAEEGFRFLSKAAPHPDSYDAALDIAADDLWNLGAGQPFGAIFREKPIILE